MARTYVNASDTTLSTNTTGSFNNKVEAILSNPVNGARYAIFWSCTLTHSSNANDARVRLQKTTGTPATLQQFNIEPELATTDVMSISDVQVYTSDGVDQTFQVQFSSETGTTSIRDAYITILLLDSSEVSNTVAAQTAGKTDAAFANIASITVDPGDWYIIASCGINVASTTQAADAIGVRINDGTNSYMLRNQYFANDTTNYTPAWLTTGLVSPTTSTTYNLQFAENSNQTLIAQYRTIVALKKSLFADSSSQRNDATQTTTSATPQVSLSLGPYTPPASLVQINYLILAWWTTETNSTTVRANSDFDQDSTSYFTLGITREAADVDDQFQQGFAGTKALTPAVATTWNIDYNAQTAGTTITILNRAIIVLNLAQDVVKPYSFGYILF
jgi:hypothetical protein